MSSYAFIRSRIFQWMGILLSLGIIAVGYWYYQSQASTLNKSPTGSLTSGLVGYWTFDGADISGTTATDRGSGGNNGTLTNTPQSTQGKNGQALNFFPNGSDGNSYVTMGDPVDGDLDFGSGDFTVSFWMKGSGYSSQGSSNNTALAKKSFTTFTSAGYGFWYGSTNVLSFTIANGTTAYSAAQPVSTVADNQWHHYVGTRSGTSTTALYVDGVKVAENTTATGSVSNSIAFIAGTDSSASPNDRNANAVIDEVRVYNTAITASQIQSLYQLGVSDKVNTSVSQPQGTGRLDSGLAGYWAMDDGSGTSATDSSTNANAGTLTGGPTWSTGQIGGAADLDGDNDLITMGDPSSGVLDFGSDNFSVGFWMNGAGYSNQGASTNTAVAKRNDSSSTAAGYSFTYPSTNIMSFTIGNGSTNFSASHTVATAGDNTWHHYVGTRIGSTIYLFVDGALVDTQSVSGSVSNTTDFQIGDSGTLGTRNSNALFDEVRVYNRTLSADEISQLYRLTSPTAVDTGLKGYWSFNAQDMSGTTAYDRSGAGNTGTLTSGPTKVLGKLGQGLDFDNSDDYVSIADNAALDFGDTDDLTITGWFNRESFAGDDTIIAKRNSLTNTDVGYLAYIDDATDQLIFEVSDGTDEYSLTSVSTFTAAGWNHFTIVWDQDSASASEIYINGVAESATDTGTIGNIGDLSNSVVLALGAESDVGNPFDGKLDEVRVYKRTLSAVEIKTQYDAGQSDKSNSSVSQPQGTGRLDSGLGGYWRLDDGTSGASPTTAADASTNGYTGTLTSGPTWTTGQIGSAVTFDGTDDYIDTDNGSAIDSLLELTYSAWIYPTSGDGFILGKRTNGGGTEGFRLISSTLQGWVANFTGSHAGRATSSTTISLSTWSLVTMTYNKNGDNKPHLYINGAEVTYSEQDTVTGSDPDDQYDFWIGRMQANGELADVPYTGNIDDVRIYNRMLSSDEVSQLYRLTTPTGVDTGLKGYWSFNGQDMSGTTAYDRSGAGNTGTLTGGPTKTQGKLGQALDFDNTDDYVSIADNAALDFGDTDDLTLTGWFNRESFAGDDTVIAKRNGIANTDDGYILYIDDTTDKLTFEVSENSGTDEYQLESTSTFTSAGWNHFTIVWDQDSASASEIYINGVADTATDTGTIGNIGDLGNAVVLAIGAESDVGNPFDGKLDEIRVYKTALSAAQIAALYNQGR